MANADAVLAWVAAKVGELTLDGVTSGAHTTDVVLNADTNGHAHCGWPPDYRTVRAALTGCELVDYHVDVHYRVAGDEAATAAKADAFADSLRSKLHMFKGGVTGVTHDDTEVTYPEHRQGEWTESRMERHARYRVRVQVQEVNPR